MAAARPAHARRPPGRRARPAAARVRGRAAHRPRGRPHPRLDQPRRRGARSCSSGCCAGASPSTASPRTGSSCTAAGSAASAGRVPRDRIRTVDLTARLEHRIFGLSVVKIGSATGGSGEHAGLALDAVSKAEADRLRRELLDRSPVARLRHPGRRAALDRARPPGLGVAALRPALVLLAGRDRHRGGRAVQPPQRGGRQPRHGSRATRSNAWPERVWPRPSG